MLSPASSRPPRIPSSTVDSPYDTAAGYSSSSYTRWPRSLAKTPNLGRISHSTPDRGHAYAGMLHSELPQTRALNYATIGPRRSLLSNLLP